MGRWPGLPAGLIGREGGIPERGGPFMLPAGDMGRDMLGLPGPTGGRIGPGLLAPPPRAYWFKWAGLGFEGLAAKQVRGTTPC